MKLKFCLQMNIKVFYKMIVSLWVCTARHAQSTQSNGFTISLQYVQENVKEKIDFLPADKRERCLQSDTIILGACSQARPYYPKNKFAMSLKSPKKVMGDAVDLHADKHESLHQFDVMIFDGYGRVFPKFRK